MSIEERDALANKRLHLRKRISTRLGMPDTVEVWHGASMLATITATEGAIVIQGDRLKVGIRVSSALGDSLRVAFEAAAGLEP